MRDFKNFKKECEEKLKTKSDNAKQEFAFLLKSVLNLNDADILLKTQINNKECKLLNRAINKRLKGVPIQLIIGYSTFYNILIKESKHTLKPRKETELMVDKIIEKENKDKSVLDMCSGSGCIGLALKNEGFKEVSLSDISKKALKMCLVNKKLNNLEVNIIKSDMFKSISQKFDIIVQSERHVKHFFHY